ncbi:hypothetical protein uan_101 [Pseudomonas phage UAntarctica]|nr:hypothetical protein uan_101 [Pseudomonas phage UAntarctica]
MEQLKAECIQICRERGDLGGHDVHQRTVERFFDELQKSFTPKGIESFTAVELREPYVAWVTAQINDGPKEQAVSFFHTRPYARQLPVVGKQPAANVVSFFRK